MCVAALACGRNQTPPEQPTGASDSGAVTGDTGETGAPIGGPEDPRAAAVDRPLRPVIVRVYGGAELVGEARDEADGAVVVDLAYDLARAHTAADGSSVVAGLKDAGFTIDRALLDERAAAIFGSTEDASVIVAVDVGSSRLKVSVAELSSAGL
ncbi:MAG: hypothetical protein KC486_35415 [Myxococcales bacterium]|nr:hypothetical protein [Myxococcales bacterium]